MVAKRRLTSARPLVVASYDGLAMMKRFNNFMLIEAATKCVGVNVTRERRFQAVIIRLSGYTIISRKTKPFRHRDEPTFEPPASKN